MCPHERHKPADLLHGQRSAVEVALERWTNTIFQMPRVLPHLCFNARPVKATLRGQLHRVVADSKSRSEPSPGVPVMPMTSSNVS